jgi:hypothetical protein
MLIIDGVEHDLSCETNKVEFCMLWDKSELGYCLLDMCTNNRACIMNALCTFLFKVYRIDPISLEKLELIADADQLQKSCAYTVI